MGTHSEYRFAQTEGAFQAMDGHALSFPGRSILV